MKLDAEPMFLSRFWLSKWPPKILQWHLKFWKSRYGFALNWSKTIWDKHAFLHVAIATWDAMKGRHNSLAQKLEAEIVRMVYVHCHAHSLASACFCTAANLYSVRKCESTLMQLWKCSTVSPLRSACLAMHQTTMKTKDRQLQRACRTRWLSSEATVRARSEILAVWAALKPLWETKNDAVGISGGSRSGVWGVAVKLGAPKCLHLLYAKGCLRQSLCVTQKRSSFVGQKVAVFVGRTMLFFKE